MATRSTTAPVSSQASDSTASAATKPRSASRARAKASTTPVTEPTPQAPAPADKADKKPKVAAPKVSKAPKVPKAPKEKLVRDSFTMPRSDFALIEQLKERSLGFKRHTKKSELLRAGLQVLAALNDAKLKSALEALVPLKAGRPKKEA